MWKDISVHYYEITFTQENMPLCILMKGFETQNRGHQRARAAAYIYALHESWTTVFSMLDMN
jgi:hypothetical protein